MVPGVASPVSPVVEKLERHCPCIKQEHRGVCKPERLDDMIEQRMLHHNKLESKSIWDADNNSDDLTTNTPPSLPQHVQSVLKSWVGETMPITRTRIRSKMSPFNLSSRHELYILPATPKRSRIRIQQEDSLASRRCILHTTQVRRIDAWTMEVVTS